MCNGKMYKYLGMVCLLIGISACTAPSGVTRTANPALPERYNGSLDTLGLTKIPWQDYFADPYLTALIDTALQNNQELNITLQEIEISKNEVRTRKGEYLPFVDIKAGAGVDKVGRYTSRGASEATTEIEPGREMPDPLPDYMIGAYATWEVDIWHKLRNGKKAAVARYLASMEGKNFMVTNLIAEIATSYFELQALDNQLDIIDQNIAIQDNALKTVRLQKQAARVTELAVRKFEAEVLHTKSLKFNTKQQIIEMENKINFLLGRYPQPIQRNSATFSTTALPSAIETGIPSQLMENRPDIRQAELELAAAKLDVKVAKARFYPSFGISAGIGYRAFDASYLVKTPESLIYSLAGDLTAPLINRNAIKATYYSANAKQLQTVYNYERTVLNAYMEVANEVSKIDNLKKSYELKSQEVEALAQSIRISNDLFKSTRADYMEVLLTQRDALESKFELIETKKEQMNALVAIYRNLGGGWQ
tara:strand:+ start:21016 stop:22452 length:1437 start_codon:yes stop_codon:yes gene_type:complete